MHKNENTQNSHSFLAPAFFRGICLRRHQQIWNQHKILRFFDTHIDIFQEKKCLGHYSTFCNLKMQMRKKLYIFKHFAKSKKLFFCQYLSFSVWFPLSLKHWSPLPPTLSPNPIHCRFKKVVLFLKGPCLVQKLFLDFSRSKGFFTASISCLDPHFPMDCGPLTLSLYTVEEGNTEHLSAFNIILKILRNIFSGFFFTEGLMHNSTSDISNHICGFDIGSRIFFF